MEKWPDILLVPTEMDTIGDASLARSVLKVRPHVGHIGAKYHYMQIGKGFSQAGGRANQFNLPLPGIHSGCDANETSTLRNAELLTKRSAVVKVFVRVEVIGIDSIMQRVDLVCRKTHGNQTASYEI